MRHHVLLRTGIHGPLNWQNRVRVTFAKLFSSAIEICGGSARLSGNYVIAMKWWRRATDRGNVTAQMKRAHLYDGWGHPYGLYLSLQME